MAIELDPKLLGRPSSFDGNETTWSDWSFQTRAYMSTLDLSMDDLLDAAERREQPLLLVSLSPAQATLAKKLYYIFAMLLKGTALVVLKQCEKGNGLECWRLLCKRFEGVTDSRLHVMLQGVLRPSAFPADAQGFEAALVSWELLISRWEIKSEDILNDSVKRQILMEQSPSTIKVQLTLQGYKTYEGLRAAVLGYVVNARDWATTSSTASAAMEVDALSRAH